jgi:hypothetical protein
VRGAASAGADRAARAGVAELGRFPEVIPLARAALDPRP